MYGSLHGSENRSNVRLCSGQSLLVKPLLGCPWSGSTFACWLAELQTVEIGQISTILLYTTSSSLALTLLTITCFSLSIQHFTDGENKTGGNQNGTAGSSLEALSSI